MKTLDCSKIAFAYSHNAPAVFDGHSFSFGQGINLLKGYSGCGKTTLLKIFAGYLKVQSGSVSTPSGRSPFSPEYQRREMSFLFQQFNLLPLATVQRNLELAGELAGLKHSLIKERANYWSEKLGLAPVAHRKAKNLSGGQQQRAAIARALIKGAQVLLLDEPTSGLDDLNTRLIVKALENMVERECICLICTHDSRLEKLPHEITDFNCFLPVERHLLALA
ncbi:MAG: ATP-binding cassette domain-containing protein [Kiritimatiellales bacterium]|nr:ATP-binding cassette domain-containing protein [Kiritimatiellales bacterium]